MILLNAKSIRNKLSEFRGLVASETTDIIAVRNNVEAEFKLHGYTMFTKNRFGRQVGRVDIH
jgi:hypothetical protein